MKDTSFTLLNGLKSLDQSHGGVGYQGAQQKFVVYMALEIWNGGQ